MTLAITSLMAYDKVKFTKNEEAVFNTLSELGLASNDDIAAELDWPVHCVTGRTNSLWTKGIIVVADHSGITKMGNKAKRWGVADQNYRQLSFIKELECEG